MEKHYDYFFIDYFTEEFWRRGCAEFWVIVEVCCDNSQDVMKLSFRKIYVPLF